MKANGCHQLGQKKNIFQKKEWKERRNCFLPQILQPEHRDLYIPWLTGKQEVADSDADTAPPRFHFFPRQYLSLSVLGTTLTTWSLSWTKIGWTDEPVAYRIVDHQLTLTTHVRRPRLLFPF